MTELDPVLREEISKAVQQGVKDALFEMGLDGFDHDAILAHRRDLTFLREQRVLCEQLRTKGVWYTMSLVILGGVSLVVLGLRNFFYAS